MKNIKVGDKFKGFKFKHDLINYDSRMDKLIGKIGIVQRVFDDRVVVMFSGYSYWAYPILKSKLKDKLK